jgi:hypothetical protein
VGFGGSAGHVQRQVAGRGVAARGTEEYTGKSAGKLLAALERSDYIITAI